ncbi:hypothetical protein [Embleya sp. MST-111070]|uniref:hypothetical protein n=1 Tax=Embleya sp. MST-111070 TaxID=3398231 RepID=UPI003F73AFE2
MLARIGTDWGRRSVAVDGLGEFAAVSPQWLLAWQSARPSSADRAVVAAAAGVRAAWNVRGAAPAKATSAQRFAGFHELLRQARDTCRLATELAPEDPTPWASWLRVDRGLGAERGVFDEHVRELRERCPHHGNGLAAALQYLCGKWHGSNEEMYAFARDAAEQHRRDRRRVSS